LILITKTDESNFKIKTFLNRLSKKGIDKNKKINNMKNKFRFIMPRLLGATVIAGVAALIITTVFKLLLAITLLAGAVVIIARSFGNRREQLEAFGQRATEGLSTSSVWAGPIHAVRSNAAGREASIVPIN